MKESEFVEKVNEIASIGNFTVTFHSTFFPRFANLRKDDLHLRIGSDDRNGRFTVIGFYPDPKSWIGHTYGIKDVKITMAETKTAVQMEREISRRFLIPYLDQLNAAIEQIRVLNETEEKRLAAGEQLFALIGSAATGGRRYIYANSIGIFKIEVCDPEHIKFELAPLPLDKALKLIEFVKGL